MRRPEHASGSSSQPHAADSTADRTADLQALGLGGDAGSLDRLDRYLALLARWNQVYNLTAVRDAEAMWSLHVLDCLAAVPPVRRRLAATPRPRILDVGSGGGLPGAVWAMLMPQAEVWCVDTVGKKVAFVRQVATELSVPNLHGHHGAVEAMAGAPFDLITSRAFAALPDFVASTRHLLAAQGCWVALKGKLPADELAALPVAEYRFHVEQIQVPHLDAQRCLVWIEPAEARVA